MEVSNNVRMPSVQKLAYGVGHCFNNLCGTMWFTYLLVYLQFVMQLPASTAGAVLMVGQFVEAIATPLSGMESDRSKGFGSYGKRKSTHLFGTFLTLFAFPLIFMELPGFDKASPEALLIYYIPVVFIFKVGWAACQISHLSMIPELSNDSNDRDDLAILRYVSDMAMDMFVYFVTFVAFIARDPETTTIDRTDGWRFRNIAFILMGFGFFFNLIFHFLTEEPPPVSDSNLIEYNSKSNDESAERIPMSMTWSDWFREKHYFQVGILLVLARLFQNMVTVFLPLFLQEGIRAPQEYLAIIPGVCQFSALLASLLVKLVLRFSTKKVAFIIGTCLAFSGCIWLGFDNPVNVRDGDIFILSAILGSGMGMMLVLSTSFVGDLIGNNTESGAYVFGSIAFIHNLLNGLSVFLVQMGHGLCDNCPTYYKNVLAHGVSSLAIISLALVLLMDPATLGQRFSGKNTLEGRERVVKRNRKYGALQKGFPLLQGHVND